MTLKDHVLQRVRSEVTERSAYSVLVGDGRVKLDAMESPYSWPTEIQEEWFSMLREVRLNRYPDPSAIDLCDDLRVFYDLPESSGLLLGNGSDELIQMIILALGGPDRPIVAPEPTFTMYRILTEVMGIKFISVPLDTDFEIDRDALLFVIKEHDPGCVFLAYPNNPTGNLFNRKTVEAAVATATGLVVVDEAYHPYCEETFLDQVPERNHLAVLRTFSKLGLAGLRLGFLTGPSAWLAEINKLRLPYNINSLTQASARFALLHQDWFAQQAIKICDERARLLVELRKFSGLIVYPSAANFVLFRAKEGCANVIFESLLQQNVLVKNLDGEHHRLKDCLRVTVSTQVENDLFLEALSIVVDR